MSDHIYLPISKGQKTKIDRETYDRLERDGYLRWNAQWVHNKYYASKNISPKGKLYLHRYVMNAQPGIVVDHIDRDPLNNTKENLRLCYHRDNCRNRGGTKATGFKGTGKWAKGNSWVAQIQFAGEHVVLGSFEREEDAAKMYDFAAIILFGEYALTNFAASKKFLKIRERLIAEINRH